METAKSFDDLIKSSPAVDTKSLIGTLSQSSEDGKFILILQDGSVLTLEKAVVKGHAELGGGLVRVDLDTTKIPTIATADGSVAPFALATPHQAAVVPFGPPGTGALGLRATLPLPDHHTIAFVDSGASGSPLIPHSLD
jgi:hypothetical protein